MGHRGTAYVRTGVRAVGLVGALLAMTACSTQSEPEAASPSAVVAVAAVGDTSCSAQQRAGYGEDRWNCRDVAVSEAVAAARPDAVLMLGDLQYDCGEPAEFESGFTRVWGSMLEVMYPVPGNHDYGEGCVGPTAGSASGYEQAFGPAVGDPGHHYYSFDLGSWHVVALDSNCGTHTDCGTDSAQVGWLRADLEAHITRCSIAVMHHPRFSSGLHGDAPNVEALWEVLDAGGVDVVLAGHEHDYERFAAMTTDGQTDQGGMRSFVVGTGGRNLRPFPGEPRVGSEGRIDDMFGYLSLRLGEGRYEWSFEPVLRVDRTPGGEQVSPYTTATDTGSAECS